MNKEPQSKQLEHYIKKQIMDGIAVSLLSLKRTPSVDLFDAEDQFELPKLYTWQLPAVITLKLVKKKKKSTFYFVTFNLKYHSVVRTELS